MTAEANSSKRSQQERIEAFRRLHVPGDPVVLYNIWDPGSAFAVTKSGAKALATSSWAVAKANGFNDGEQIPFDLAIQKPSPHR
jgi:2-methylisocitrate lyase-like PEP mutase family enzyme